jgi:hypothetical protein
MCPFWVPSYGPPDPSRVRSLSRDAQAVWQALQDEHRQLNSAQEQQDRMFGNTF